MHSLKRSRSCKIMERENSQAYVFEQDIFGKINRECERFGNASQYANYINARMGDKEVFSLLKQVSMIIGVEGQDFAENSRAFYIGGVLGMRAACDIYGEANFSEKLGAVKLNDCDQIPSSKRMLEHQQQLVLNYSCEGLRRAHEFTPLLEKWKADLTDEHKYEDAVFMGFGFSMYLLTESMRPQQENVTASPVTLETLAQREGELLLRAVLEGVPDITQGALEDLHKQN